MISGEGVHFHQASQGNYHLINLFVVNHLGFPCNSVEHIEKKVWIHLGLKSTDLGIFYKKFLLIKLVIIAEKTVFTASYYTMILSEMLKISLRINLFLYYHQFLQIYKTGGAGYNESMTGSGEARTSGSSSRPKRQSGVGCRKRAKTKKV